MKRKMSLADTICHYDALINENNDPVYDPEPAKVYMDKWDGKAFMDALQLSPEKDVLEIGVGTGRLAVKTVPVCREFYGIDISPKTIERAKENLAGYSNIHFICGDFMTHSFNSRFDVVYSSLTFMHIKDKLKAIQKTADLLNRGGRFVLSIDKNQQTELHYNDRTIEVFPDMPEEIAILLNKAGLTIEKKTETEFAHIYAAVKV